MKTITLGLIFISVFLSVVAQILLKHGMSNKGVKLAIETDVFSATFTILTNLSVFLGLTAYVTSAAVWLFVLTKVDVSKAYPFVGLGFIGTMLFAYWFLNEPMNSIKIVGTLLIVLGVLLISR